LLAPDVSFGRLHRRVTKEKLKLFELASCALAEAGATATKIVWCQIFDSGSPGTSFYRTPDYIEFHSSILPNSIL
jgi:hypothetical protein